MNLTHKQLLELKYWLTRSEASLEHERNRARQLLDLFGLKDDGAGLEILDIGAGPQFGVLPFFPRASRAVAVDDLYDAYYACSLLPERGDIFRVSEPFEHWDTDWTFHRIITTNALDHGAMGFYLLPKIWKMLRPGGEFYCHVHLRPKELLNLLHDHLLTMEQLDKHMRYTNLVPVKVELRSTDLDGFPSPTLIGRWRKPE